MSKKKLLFVINPVAGGGKSHGIEKLIKQHLDQERYEFELFYTQHPKHAAELNKLGLTKDVDAIVAVGGDGSVNEVAKNLIGQTASLGIVPMGSGNGLARHLKIPLNPIKAIERLNEFETQQIDTASLNGQLFLNVAGVGFDALVSRQFATSEKRGFLGYIWHTVLTFIRYKANEYNLIIDGVEKSSRAFLIAIANISQYGNNAYIAPTADAHDNMLDITIIKPISIFSAPFIGYHLFNKSLHTTSYCEFYRGKEIQLKQKATIAHYDGETIEPGNDLTIKVQPSSLTILT